MLQRRRPSCRVILLLAGSLVWLTGCQRQVRDERPVIGLAVPSLTHPFFIYLKDNVLDEARQLGVEVIAADAEDVAARQMAVVEDFIARDVAGVLMSPIGADALVPAVESLNAAGIPVATVDRQVNGGDVLVHVGADNVEGGRLAARYILEQLGGKGDIIQLEGTPGASPAIDRKGGFEEALGNSSARIVASQPADFQRAKGQTVMENLLQVHENFQAVYAANDEMMLGAIEAMEARKIDAARVVTVGYDAIPDAIRYVREGRLDATVEQYPGQQARTALRLLVEYIREKKRPAAPHVFIKPVVIDARNIDAAEQKR
jgi:ribose transport system substrate-binding protein